MTAGVTERRSQRPAAALRSLTVLSRAVSGRDPAIPLYEELSALGCEPLHADDDSFVPGEAEAVLVWGNACWFPRSFARLAALPRQRRPLVAIWHSEPLPFASAAGLRLSRPTVREIAKIVLRDSRTTDPHSNARRLTGLVSRAIVDLVVVTSEGARDYLAERGIDAEVVPRGYHPAYGSDLGVERDLDAVFLGALEVPRRRRILRDLERAGVHVVARGSWSDPRYWGTQRTAFLNRARIALNVGRHPGQFAGERFVVAMANGALVVSEPVHRPAPFRPGEHYVEAGVDELAAAVRRHLADEDARRRIAAAGHAFVTRKLTLARSAERLVALLSERLARGHR